MTNFTAFIKMNLKSMKCIRLLITTDSLSKTYYT